MCAPVANPVYFHVCNRVYKPGASKPAGVYWHGLVGAGHSASNDPDGEFYREALRAASYSSLPSRSKSSFVFETLTDASTFRDAFRPDAKIYKVQFAIPTAPRHRVSLYAFNPSSGAPLLVQAHEFWSGGMLYSSNIEVFAESDLLFL
jgi:hypothetical protein